MGNHFGSFENHFGVEKWRSVQKALERAYSFLRAQAKAPTMALRDVRNALNDRIVDLAWITRMINAWVVC